MRKKKEKKRILIMTGLVFVLVGLILLGNRLYKGRTECTDSLECPEKMYCQEGKCVEVRCLREGEEVPALAVTPGDFLKSKHMATECCAGLQKLPLPQSFDKDCNFKIPPPGTTRGAVCSACGNGRCEEWESRCNCPQDCD